jgi:phosphoribosylformylglycinamidine synthase
MSSIPSAVRTNVPVGLVADVRRVPGTWHEGDAVYLAGAPELRLDGSEYQDRFLGGPAGRPPAPDLEAEAALIAFLASVAPAASCVHDASEGGLAVCLAECAIAAGLGAEVDLATDAVSLYGEGGGQAVVAGRPAEIEALATRHGVPIRQIGRAAGETLLGVPVGSLRAAYDSALAEAS